MPPNPMPPPPPESSRRSSTLSLSRLSSQRIASRPPVHRSREQYSARRTQSLDTSGVISVDAALSFIREQGVVLVSAKGPAARLTELIAGEPIRGSWWGHPKSHEIFEV